MAKVNTKITIDFDAWAFDNIEIHKNNQFNFYAFNYEGKNLPKQGWKIHVSSNLKDYNAVLKIVANYCFKNKVDFKYINNYQLFVESISKQFSRIASGKFITIYPTDVAAFKKILQDLYVPLQKYEGPYIWTDQKYLDSKVLFYRYGAFADDNNTLITPTGAVITDIIGPEYHLPSFVKEPFPTPTTDVGNENPLFQKYEFLNALHFSNAGGIYLAKDKQSGVLVVIKEARKHIIDRPDGDVLVETYAQRAAEYALLTKLNAPFFPKPLGQYFVADHAFYVYEHMDGEDLTIWKQRYTLINAQPGDQPNIDHKMNAFYAKIIPAFEQFLHYAKANGLVINDINENNFLFDQQGNLYCVDLEHAYLLAEQTDGYAPQIITNYFFCDKRLLSHNHDAIKIAYLLIELFFVSNSLLKHDRSGERLLNKFLNLADLYQIPKPFVSKIYEWGQFAQIVAKATISPQPAHYENIANFLKMARTAVVKDNSHDHDDDLLADHVCVYLELETLYCEQQLSKYEALANKYMHLVHEPFANLDFYKLLIISLLNLNETRDWTFQKQIFQFITDKYLVLENNQYYIKSENFLFPFLNGILGYWYLLIKYTYLSNDHQYDKIITHINQTNLFYFANKFGLFNGTMGIALIAYWLHLNHYESVLTQPLQLNWLLQNLNWHLFVDYNQHFLASYYFNETNHPNYFLGTTGIFDLLQKIIVQKLWN